MPRTLTKSKAGPNKSWEFHRRFDFTAGLQIKTSNWLLPEGALIDVMNWYFDEVGALSTRRGYVKYNSSALPDIPVRQWRSRVLSKLLVASATGIREVTPSAINLLKSWTTGAGWVDFKEWLNYVVIAAKDQDVLKYDGTAFTRVGIDAPAGAPSLADGGAGNLNGTYSYKITFASATQESSPGPVSANLAVTSRQIQLTNIPTSPQSEVTKRRIYRTGGAVNVYRLVATINDNTTSSYLDNIPDAQTTTEVVDDQSPPPKSVAMEVFRNRMFYFPDGEVGTAYYSQVGNFESVPKANQLLFRPKDGDPIVSAVTVGTFYDTAFVGMLLVLKKRSTWIVTGDGTSTNPFVVTNVSDIIGCVAPGSVVKLELAAIFLSHLGVYIFGGRELISISQNSIDSIFNPLAVAPKENHKRIEPSKYDDACAAYYDKRYYLSFTEEGETQNSITYVWDKRMYNPEKGRFGAWTKFDMEPRVFGVLDAPSDKGELLSVGYDKYVYKQDTNFNDDGRDITAWFKTKYEDYGTPEMVKRVGSGHFFIEKSSRQYDILLDADNQDQVNQQTVDAQAAIAWGASTWGGTIWAAGEGLDDKFLLCPPQFEGRNIALRVSTIGQVIKKFYGYELKLKRRSLN